MISDRFQRRMDRILDQIEDAADRRDWAAVRQGALDLLVFDPENADAKNFLAAAQRALGQDTISPDVQDASPAATWSSSSWVRAARKRSTWPMTASWTGTWP